MGTKTDEIIRLTQKYCAHNYHPLPVVLKKAKGVWVWDVEGKKYLDMLSCYSALNHGHRHPKIERTLIKQVKRLANTSRAFHNDQLGLFCEELAELCGMEMILPKNTGAEAVETAIKAVRKWGYKVKRVPPDQAEIVVCENNFHGRTTTIIGFSSEFYYREGFGPFTPGFVLIPFDDTESLEAVINTNTVAFLVEPIQGEGGINIPCEDYLKKVREICTKNNVLLVLDEIQTGLGRTGKMFAYEYEDIKPDVLIVGKALGGGVYPVSAVVSSHDILGVFYPGDDGSTFGGNPLACAVARKSLKVLVEEKLMENSAKMGKYFMSQLEAVKSPYIKEVRGRGLLIGVELRPEAGGGRRFCEKLLEQKILCNVTHENVIRFAPPLIITKKQIDWTIKRIKEVFEK